MFLAFGLPLLAQGLPEPGADPRLRSRLQAGLTLDPMAAWRAYLQEGTPMAVVEVVATYTEAERHEMALQESFEMLRADLHELYGLHGSALTREHRVALLGDSPVRVYPLGRPMRR